MQRNRLKNTPKIEEDTTKIPEKSERILRGSENLTKPFSNT